MRIRASVLTIALLVVLSASVPAGPLTHVIVYGDSLSDNGNFYAATGQPPAPYWNGRVSNGPVAAELVAAGKGVTLFDFAWAGATTGTGNINDSGTTTTLGSFGLPGMKTAFDQTKGLLAPIAASSQFILWGGAMDFIYPAEPIPQIIARGVGNLVQMTAELQAMGATNIIVLGMPDLGLTPRAMSYGPDAAAGFSQVTDAFNATLVSSLPPGAVYFDTAALLRQITANPAAYGLSNVTQPCFAGDPGPSICANPDSYLFWDDIHPTTATHGIVAQGLLAIPEPATIFFVAPALAVAFLVRRRSSFQAR